MKNKTSTKTALESSLRAGSIVFLIIAFSPFIYYLYTYFPEGKTWETVLFTYESEYYKSVYMMGWVFMGKFIPLLLLFLWFFTCKHWWRHAILIPIGMYLFQLIAALNDDLQYFDIVEIWYIFPVMLIVVPLVYYIRAKLFASLHDQKLEDFEESLGKKQNFFQLIKELFR